MLTALTMCIVLAGCGDDDDGDDAPAPTLDVVATPTTVAAGGTMSLAVTVTDFEFTGDHDPHGHSKPVRNHEEGHAYSGPRTGHFHVYLDNLEAGTEPLLQGTSAPVDIVIPADTGAGQHTLMVRLHGPDHKIITPEIVDTVPFTVSSP